MKYNDNGEYKDIYVKAFDTLPVNSQVRYAGDTIPEGWQQTLDYSTDEVKTGELWIDGKPLYRKVFNFNSPSDTNTTNVATISDLHIDTLVRDYFSINTGSNITTSSNNTNATIHIRLNYNNTGDYIAMTIINAAYNSKPTYVTLEYTKTTD